MTNTDTCERLVYSEICSCAPVLCTGGEVATLCYSTFNAHNNSYACKITLADKMLSFVHLYLRNWLMESVETPKMP